MSIYEPPLNELLAALFIIVGGFAAARGARRLWHGLSRAVPLDLIRGIRDWVVALVAGACTAWILSAHIGFLVLGLLVLGEELYETTLVAFVIRLGDTQAADGSARTDLRSS